MFDRLPWLEHERLARAQSDPGAANRTVVPDPEWRVQASDVASDLPSQRGPVETMRRLTQGLCVECGEVLTSHELADMMQVCESCTNEVR